MEKIASPSFAPPAAARVLIVDDEWKIRDSLGRGIRKVESWTVELAPNGTEALAKLSQLPIDLLVLDWMLPDVSGLEILRHIRTHGLNTAVLMVTARDAVADRVSGIEAGADDYLVKPFAFEELLARCRAILRRREANSAAILRCADLELDMRARIARRQGQEIPLTPIETNLLEYLLERLHTVITRDMLVRAVWSGDPTAERTNAINIHVARLRQKIDSVSETKLIHTVRGLGYCCGPNPPEMSGASPEPPAAAGAPG
jgi:DNA-binding response OmpR family regulator